MRVLSCFVSFHFFHRRVWKCLLKQRNIKYNQLRGRPILQIARIITDRIGLHSVLLPSLVIVIVSIGLQKDRDESCEPVRYARFDFNEQLTSKQWRCYRPSGLTRDKARYNGESGVYNTVHGAMLQIREGMRIEVRFSIRMGKKYLTKRTVHRVELIQRGLHNSQRQAFLVEIVYSLWWLLQWQK